MAEVTPMSTFSRCWTLSIVRTGRKSNVSKELFVLMVIDGEPLEGIKRMHQG